MRRLADSDRIPHALLLEGPSGTAKFALARAFAQYVHCTSRTGGDSCGRCPSCRQHETFNHADTLFSFPVVKKGSGPTRSDDYLPEFREFISDSPWMDFERWLSMLDNINAQPNIFPKIFYDEWENPPYDFSLDLYALYMARTKNLKVVRFPVLFPERIHGESKWNTGLQSKWKFIKRTIEFSVNLKKNGNV